MKALGGCRRTANSSPHQKHWVTAQGMNTYGVHIPVQINPAVAGKAPWKRSHPWAPLDLPSFCNPCKLSDFDLYSFWWLSLIPQWMLLLVCFRKQMIIPFFLSDVRQEILLSRKGSFIPDFTGWISWWCLVSASVDYNVWENSQ